jgi:hypothetical protein
MKTTLNKIRSQSPCADGWTKLLKNLGKTKADDEELSLAVILESNGLDDAIWCLRAVDGHAREIRLYAVECARMVQHLMSDRRSLDALDVAERHANGLATDSELAAAWAAAWAAARDAASDAARAAASDAASEAASDAARAAASDAARAAAWATDSELAAAWAAAWAAARAAASDAARAAARDAARDAARAAASDAARAAQANLLALMCVEIEFIEAARAALGDGK